MNSTPLKLVIIGNGTAGSTAASKAIKNEPNISITIISEENHGYYSRPQLPYYIANTKSLEQIQIHKKDWYKQNNIHLIENTNVIDIDKENKNIVLKNKQTIPYDKLLLAQGACPLIPNIKGGNLPGIFVLRNIPDANKIKEHIKQKKAITVIGGGLLGLELAHSLISIGKTVNTIERADHLLPKLLNNNQSSKLQLQLENIGFNFFTDESCKEIEQKNNKLIITTEKKTQIESETIILSIGVKPKKSLAAKAGLKTNRGIFVNEFLQTENPNIYAAGDCIEFNGQCWGFVKATLEQAQIAIDNITLGNHKKYNGSDINPILKIPGINLKEL
jgi:nitrite reductase (NADH) large subunit